MSRNKKVVVTPAKLDRIEQEIINKALIVMCATLMDEFNFDNQQIVDFAKLFEKYCSAVDQKLISLKKIQDIIAEEIDLKFRWL